MSKLEELQGLLYFWLIGVGAIILFPIWAPAALGILAWGILEQLGLVESDWERSQREWAKEHPSETWTSNVR